jgi:ABC-type protease/lipase transport system fused ATPase/permease subunit
MSAFRGKADIKSAAAWRRFVTCVSALPPDQAAPLWQAALSEARSMTTPTPLRQGSGCRAVHSVQAVASMPAAWIAVAAVAVAWIAGAPVGVIRPSAVGSSSVNCAAV